ncbi:MAG TPA: hypothetical protein VHG51_08360, partial [Longimicrobiaceae bacterium]|nr:hypothetical protein [Longimicrobiaceae bacterium]
RAPAPAGPTLRDEVARRLPGMAAGGASITWRLVVALFVLVRSALGWAALGGLVGLAAGFFLTGSAVPDGLADPDVLWAGAFGLLGGGLLGLLVGLVRALRVLFASRR